MYEPAQIVCMAPFFCTRKAITETLLPSWDENNIVLMILAAIQPNGQGSLFDHQVLTVHHITDYHKNGKY